MAKFSYKAKKGLYQILEGVIEANGEEDAISKLSEEGLFVTSLNEILATAEKIQKQNPPKTHGKKVSSKDILIFADKLATLIKARVELLSGLKIIYEQTDNPRLREIIHEIYGNTKEGRAFSESLAHFPEVFSSLFVNLIKAGEVSGHLDTALDQIREFLSRQESLRTKITVALAYPVLLLFVGVTSIFILINFVVPRLRPLFENLGKDIPMITKAVLYLSTLSSKTWFIVFGVIAAIIIILYRSKGDKAFRIFFIRIKRKIPVIKRLVINQELVYVSRAFSLLLRSGVPALVSLEIITLTIEDPILKEGMKQVCHEVASGKSLYKSMEFHTKLPPFFTKMVAVGEESGRLSEVLDEVSNSYANQVEADIAVVSSLIEPLLILILGAILGTIVLAILLPTFQISQMVR